MADLLASAASVAQGILGTQERGLFVRVNVHESRDFNLAVPAVALRIYSQTTASDMCSMVVQKLKLPSFKVQDASLVFVYATRSPGKNGVKHLMHTLGGDELPVQVQDEAIQAFKEGDLSEETEGARHEELVRWYFRDVNSSPLDLDLDVSGAEESDDEDSTRHRPQDLAHLNDDNCTRCAGFLLKQSETDPNLWRKRFCILAGDKLWYMKRRPHRTRGTRIRAFSIPLVSSRVEEAPSKTVPFAFELHTVDRVFCFRAFGRSAKKAQLSKVQKGWVQALQVQIKLSDENHMIGMAEHITSDTRRAYHRRQQRELVTNFLEPSLTSTVVANSLSTLSITDDGPDAPTSSMPPIVLTLGNQARVVSLVNTVDIFRKSVCHAENSLEQQWIAARVIFRHFFQHHLQQRLRVSQRFIRRLQNTASRSNSVKLITSSPLPHIDDIDLFAVKLHEAYNVFHTRVHDLHSKLDPKTISGPPRSPSTLFDSFYADSLASVRRDASTSVFFVSLEDERIFEPEPEQQRSDSDWRVQKVAGLR